MNPHDEAAQLVRAWLRTASPATQLSAADEEALRARIADLLSPFVARLRQAQQIAQRGTSTQDGLTLAGE